MHTHSHTHTHTHTHTHARTHARAHTHTHTLTHSLTHAHPFPQVCPGAKVTAIADGLAAALGVAAENRELKNALVIVLGTAPAAATFFRDPSGKGRYLEAGIWQSWVWFTKIKLDDPHGYFGGLRHKSPTRPVTGSHATHPFQYPPSTSR